MNWKRLKIAIRNDAMNMGFVSGGITGVAVVGLLVWFFLGPRCDNPILEKSLVDSMASVLHQVDVKEDSVKEGEPETVTPEITDLLPGMQDVLVETSKEDFDVDGGLGKGQFFFWKPFSLMSKAKLFASQITAASGVDCRVEKTGMAGYQVYYDYENDPDRLAKATRITKTGVVFIPSSNKENQR